MYLITILKSSGEIIDYRVDNSVPQYWSTNTLKSAISLNLKIVEDLLETYSFDILPEFSSVTEIESLTPHIHVYDAITNCLKNNPTYIAPATERKFSINDIISKLSLLEKSKFNNSLSPTIATVFAEMKNLRNEADTTEILQFLVESGDISQASMDKILEK